MALNAFIECYYTECRYAEYHCAECHHAECDYAECRGATATYSHKVHKMLQQSVHFRENLTGLD